jgi:UDP:flavonoid glycosyltransferase YjiC (YdhE family)
MEGTRNGVPFLCWPYFCDQYLDRSYITNVWRTGLAVSPNADGIVTKEELCGKVEQVIGDGQVKERVRLFKDAARRCIGEGGSSYDNFTKFVNLLLSE